MLKRPTKLVMLAAGGTGGHLFPAQALAEELARRQIAVHLITDERVRDYGKSFPAAATHMVPSASLSLSDPLRIPQRLWRLYSGYRKAKGLMRQYRPNAVVGFGGYPSLPPLLAATHCGVSCIVHEQNSVLGRANKLLVPRVDAVATSFENVKGIAPSAQFKVQLTGNPVRGAVMQVAGAHYPALTDSGLIRLLIFGGSQGARFFSDAMPEVLAALPETMRNRLRVTQQCRSEDIERVRAAYGRSGLTPELQPFFSNMPELLSQAHLVVCRSGASSIAELGVVGRPAILVPLPGAIDNDQLHNAESFARAGGGFVHPQASLTTQHFATILQQLLSNGVGLKEAALAALRHGRPDAAQRLADLVEQQMGGSNAATQEK